MKRNADGRKADGKEKKRFRRRDPARALLSAVMVFFFLAFLLLAACSSPKPVTGDYPDQVSYYNASEGVAAQGGSGVALKVLNPGGKKEINQNLKINVVFLGYQQGTAATNVNTAPP